MPKRQTLLHLIIHLYSYPNILILLLGKNREGDSYYCCGQSVKMCWVIQHHSSCSFNVPQ